MKIRVKLNNYRVEDIERDDKSLSWIEQYKKTHQEKLPPLPNWMLHFVNFHIAGDPITKDIQIIPISGQQWQKLTNNERAELLELVEFTGRDVGDYCREFQSMYPRDPDFSKRK